MNEIKWACKFFDDLTLRELYAVQRLRNEVFVVEQQCPYQDADKKDFYSWHYMGTLDGELVAYTRLLPKGVSFEEASIGRVITSPLVRGTGIGKELVEKSIHQLFELFGEQPIHIGAQLYLKKFYESFGFKEIGAVYLEDGIEHIEMIRPLHGSRILT